MTSIFYVLIILPLFFLIVLAFIFASSVQEIEQHQTVLNCPFPVNSGIANLTATQNPPQINYTVTSDASGTDYHITTFECKIDPNSDSAIINTRVYTADLNNNWFDMGAQASGYMFYISECIDTAVMKITTFANLAYLILNAPALVTGLAWFSYVSVTMFFMIGLGLFMVIRG